MLDFLNLIYINMNTVIGMPMGRGMVRSTLDGDNTDFENWLIIGGIFLVIIGIFYYLKSKEIKPTKFGRKRSKFKD